VHPRGLLIAFHLLHPPQGLLHLQVQVLALREDEEFGSGRGRSELHAFVENAVSPDPEGEQALRVFNGVAVDEIFSDFGVAGESFGYFLQFI
jgi:hypothetical protein